MSFSVPGPQRRDIYSSSWSGKQEKSVVAKARQEAEQLASRPPRDQKSNHGNAASSRPRAEEMIVAASGPPALRRLLAGEAHVALIGDLRAAEALWEKPAYNGEHTVLQMRLAIRCCTSRTTSISLTWKDKQQYWVLLEKIPSVLTQQTPETLLALRRNLETLRPVPD
jgi:hypothetical protein